MTNLLIGTAGIPAEAVTYTIAGHGAESGYPLLNLFGSHKADFFRKVSTNSGLVQLTFDLGAAVTRAADFLYLGKASMLMRALVNTIRVRHHTSDDYAAATEALVIDSATFVTGNLMGPGLDDYLATFAETPARRWWYIAYSATGQSFYPHAKAFLGKAIDPGLDPTAVTVTRTKPSHGRRRALYTVELQWRGLTEANARNMANTIGARRQWAPVILFTKDYHELLFNHRVLFGRVEAFSTAITANNVFDAAMTFQEMP
jgi:hypothetical protein